MKIKYKLKQSTSNFKNHFVRDSKVIVTGTLFMFMLFSVVNVSAVSYKIVYDDNVVSGMPEDVRSTTMNDSENISSDKPTRDGYSFLKWCTQIPASDGTCPGTAYDAGVALPIVGTSKNEYKLYAMWQEEIPKTYIQDLTLSQCQVNVGVGDNPANVGDVLTVHDKRDESDYTVRYINGECWMTQNLRFQGTSLNSTTSNVASTYTEASPYGITWYSFKNDSDCKGTSITTNNSTYMCKEDSGSETAGVWYNYSAATTHTITGTSNSTAATYDICPAGWHLPTGPSTTSGRDFNKLVGNTTSGWQNPTAGLTAFGAVPGGLYRNGSLIDTGNGRWWSATAYSTTSRYLLRYYSSNGQFYGDNSDYGRYLGFFVRCVRSS